MDITKITLVEFFVWAFGGVGASYLFYVLALKKNNSGVDAPSKAYSIEGDGNAINEVSNGSGNSQATVSVNFYASESGKDNPVGAGGAESKTEVSLERKKNNTRILFIDDETTFKLVKILKKSGWLHTKLVKDIDSLDQAEVYQADMIFVDIQGVGVELGFSEQGLGLASALKRKYPEKKIIIYSAEQTGDRFHRALREVDDFLPKDADPYQFQSIVEQYAKG